MKIFQLAIGPCRIFTFFKPQGAEAGDPISQFCYSKCLEKGKGVKKDRQAAAHWMNVLQETDSEQGEYLINYDWKKELGISW